MNCVWYLGLLGIFIVSHMVYKKGYQAKQWQGFIIRRSQGFLLLSAQTFPPNHRIEREIEHNLNAYYLYLMPSNCG